MRGKWVTIAVCGLLGLALLPAGAAAKPGKDDDTVVRKYVVTYSGTWHYEDSFPAGDGVATTTEDATWDLRSKGKPIQMTTSKRLNFGAVEGGVVAREMLGSASKTTTLTETGFPDSTRVDTGADLISASLDADEGTDKQHALGASGLDYGSYGDREEYPMDIDGRRPRKGYALRISSSKSGSESGTKFSSSIEALWTLELASKKPR